MHGDLRHSLYRVGLELGPKLAHSIWMLCYVLRNLHDRQEQ